MNSKDKRDNEARKDTSKERPPQPPRPSPSPERGIGGGGEGNAPTNVWQGQGEEDGV